MQRMSCLLATLRNSSLEQAAAAPDATALATDSATWTYAELDGSAERIAAGLLAAGMPPGARVGVMLDRSPEQIATVLGVLKAGAAVVPLDPSYPQARIDAMIERVRPFRVISDLAEVRALMQVTATATLPAIGPESAAYVLFTSGSTGEPKGVTMPHRALANLITWQNRRPSGAVGGSTLQFFPLSFDVSFQEIFSTLCGGGTLRLVSESQRKDLRATGAASSPTRGSNAYFCPASHCRHSRRRHMSRERGWSRCAW